MVDKLLTSFALMATSIRLSYAEAVDKDHKAVADVLFPHLQQRVADPNLVGRRTTTHVSISCTYQDTDLAAKEACRDALLAIFHVALDGADLVGLRRRANVYNDNIVCVGGDERDLGAGRVERPR